MGVSRVMTEEHTGTKVRTRRRNRWLAVALVTASGLIAASPALAATPALAAPALAAPPVLAATPVGASTTSGGSGIVVTRSQAKGGTLFYDPDTHIAAIANFTAEALCDPSAEGEVYLNNTEVVVPNQTDPDYYASGHNVPVYLYRTTTPMSDLADLGAWCADGAFVTPPIGKATVSLAWSIHGATGIWEQTAGGTYVNAAGRGCLFSAYGQGPFTYEPYHYDAVANINMHGC